MIIENDDNGTQKMR